MEARARLSQSLSSSLDALTTNAVPFSVFTANAVMRIEKFRSLRERLEGSHERLMPAPSQSMPAAAAGPHLVLPTPEPSPFHCTAWGR